jgi:hypothetical protein
MHLKNFVKTPCLLTCVLLLALCCEILLLNKMQTTVRQNIENVLKVSEFYCENIEKSQFSKISYVSNTQI